MKKFLTSVVLGVACLVAPSAFAQEVSTSPSGETMVRYEYVVTSVIAQVNADNRLELVVSGTNPDTPDGEVIIGTERVGNAFFVDIYQDVPPTDIAPHNLQPFELTIPADDLLLLDKDFTLASVLVVNQRLYSIFMPAIEALPGAENTPIIAPLLQENTRQDLPIDAVTFVHTPDGTVDLQVRGYSTDGCLTMIYRARPNWQDKSQFIVELYRAIDPAMMCAQGIVAFDQAIVTNATVQDVTTWVINGVQYQSDPTISADKQTHIPQPMGVENVQLLVLESLPPQYSLTVSGYTDGCENPIQVVQGQRFGDTIYVSVVRTILEQQMCTMIAREFTASLTINTAGLPSGQYKLVVNNDKTVEFGF